MNLNCCLRLWDASLRRLDAGVTMASVDNGPRHGVTGMGLAWRGFGEVIFITKVMAFMCVHLRSGLRLPRFRFDQLMDPDGV